ncbi:MAG: hypothetical protein MUC36_06055 [Planctomycetes bacterium]|jgi:hypothetical protein|nr:hypothetical protein [Planctomycetota bacterium]
MSRASTATALLLVACASPTAAPADTAAAVGPQTWLRHMEQLDVHCSELHRALLQSPQGDLKQAAATAQQAAATLALGYGRFENQQVPGFARYARDAESWLLQVALEARQHHGDLAADLFRTGRERHCTACHDAYERAGR